MQKARIFSIEKGDCEEKNCAVVEHAEEGYGHDAADGGVCAREHYFTALNRAGGHIAAVMLDGEVQGVEKADGAYDEKYNAEDFEFFGQVFHFHIPISLLGMRFQPPE